MIKMRIQDSTVVWEKLKSEYSSARYYYYYRAFYHYLKNMGFSPYIYITCDLLFHLIDKTRLAVSLSQNWIKLGENLNAWLYN